MVAAILLAIFAPGRAFLLLYGVAVAGMFFVWIVILLAHLAFRRSLGQARVARLPVRLSFSPGMQIVALIGLVALALSTFYVDGLRYSLPSFLSFLLLITAFYLALKRRNSRKLSQLSYGP